MPCDTRTLPGQTLTQRKEEVKTAVDALAKALASGSVKPVIDKATGALAFPGWSDAARSRVTDACAYRRLLVSGSSQALMAIQRAEMLAGRKVDRQMVAQGVHAHSDGRGGLIWHDHKG